MLSSLARTSIIMPMALASAVTARAWASMKPHALVSPGLATCPTRLVAVRTS